MSLRGAWRKNFSMARLSSWRAGGPAERLYMPADAEDMAAFHREHGAGDLYVGHGSNLLVRDGGVEGVVVRSAPGLSALRIEDDGAVYAEAGVGCPKLARFAASAGFAEAAFLAGVPGTVGGALAMNAGCEGSEIWDFVEEASIAEGGELRACPRSEFEAGYRRLSHQGGGSPFFAGARLRFAPSSPESARARIRALLARRRETQPLGEANCGSVFRNPPGGAAGALIEQCGLKGKAVGNARVSEKHANFIINAGGATAADIEELIEAVQEEVRQRTGVNLEPEVTIAGRRPS